MKNSDLLFRVEGDYKSYITFARFPRKRDEYLQPPFGSSFGTEDGEALSDDRDDSNFHGAALVVRGQHAFQARESLRDYASDVGRPGISADGYGDPSLE